MVSNVENEQNWNQMKERLTNNRRKKVNRAPYDNIQSNKKLYGNPNLAPRLPNSYNKSQLPPKKMLILNKNLVTAYSPLATPTNFRNNSISRGDPYGGNPIPKIQSPYMSGREPVNAYPNLESWGVTTDYMNRVGSPYLPIYNTLTRNKLGAARSYVVVPSLPATPGYAHPLMNNYTQPDLKLPDRPDIIKAKAILFGSNYDTEQAKSDDLLRNARNVLNNIDPNNYNGKDLFSTKFMDDLDRLQHPNRLLRNKILEPVKPTLQDMVVEHMFIDADKMTFQTEGKSNNQKKKNFLKNIQKMMESRNDGEEFRFDDLGIYFGSDVVKEDMPQRPEKREAPVPAPRFAKNTVAIDLAQTLYEQEMKKLLQQIAEVSINEQRAFQSHVQTPIFDTVFESVLRKMLEDIATEELNLHNKKLKMVQSNEIKKLAKENIVDNLALDHMLGTMAQHGKVVAEEDGVGNLLDTMELNILLQVNTNVTKSRDKTMKNYPLKKFCLNSFMNVALDILVAELSAGLEEDMKDLNEIESNFLF